MKSCSPVSSYFQKLFDKNVSDNAFYQEARKVAFIADESDTTPHETTMDTEIVSS